MIGRNLLLLFNVLKITGILLFRFEDGKHNESTEKNLFQKRRCCIGMTANATITSFFIYIAFNTFRVCIDQGATVKDVFFIAIFTTLILILLNTHVGDKCTLVCVNEAYELMRICKINDPVPIRQIFLLTLPVWIYIMDFFILSMPPNVHSAIIHTALALQSSVAVSTSMIIVFVLRISEKSCEKIISDLIALGCSSPNTCYFKIRRVLALYIKVADFVDSITPTFSFKILCLVAEYIFSSYFVMILIFGIYQGRIQRVTVNFLGDFIPFFTIQYRMIILCSISNHMQRKASMIEKHVDNLLVRAVMKDQHLLKTKLEAFKVEIQTRRYNISPYGFFNLNMDLYTSILTVLASNYAMILQLFKIPKLQENTTFDPMIDADK